MGKKILVLGSGVAGSIVANQIVRKLPSDIKSGEISITVLGTTDTHSYQPGWLYLPFDLVRNEELKRSQRSIFDPMINFIVDPATHIDLETNKVIGTSGKVYEYDVLVIATGSVPRPDLIPGLSEGGHWFHTEEGALRLQSALREFKGGKIVIAMGVPHKCPVAPLEVTLMLDDFLRKKGIREKSEIFYTYPVGAIHTIPAVAKWAVPVFEERDIRYETFFNMKEVDVEKKIIHSLEGSSITFDLLISIPPHRGSKVITDSGLGEGGWIPTNKQTLQMEGQKNVFVVGDTTNLPISKAGSTAHFSADIVVENVISVVRGGGADHLYDGKVFCFIETGKSQATYISFNYTNPPLPPPPTSAVHWMKLSYNRLYWLTAKGIL